VKRKVYKYPAKVRHRVRRTRYKRLPEEPYGQNFQSPRGKLAIRSMQEVAEIMGIHKSRVHQLERLALWKIRSQIGNFL
jgi:hypothetical protein